MSVVSPSFLEIRNNQINIRKNYINPLPYQFEYFWSGMLTLFHTFFHGNYYGIGLIISTMLGAFFSRT